MASTCPIRCATTPRRACATASAHRALAWRRPAGLRADAAFRAESSHWQMRGVAELAAAHPGVWVQTHVARATPRSTGCAGSIRRHGKSPTSTTGWGRRGRAASTRTSSTSTTPDRRRLREAGAAVAVCPSSNLFLGSGLFDFAAADAAASGGWAATVAAPAPRSRRSARCSPPTWRGCAASRCRRRRCGTGTRPARRARRLADGIGNLAPGLEADFIVLEGDAAAGTAYRGRGVARGPACRP